MALSYFGYARPVLALAGLALWGQLASGHVDPALLREPAVDKVAQADAIRTSDHPRFVEMLATFHSAIAELTTIERWHLRFLDGWEANYQGRFPEAEVALRDVMGHASDDALATRATAMLMNNLTDQGKYAEAYVMATRAAETLPDVTDPMARFALLANLSQMLTFAGQPSLGLKYADMMVQATPAGQSPCQAMVQKIVALEGARQLTSHSEELPASIDVCTATGQTIFANAARLILVDRLFAEHKLDEALAYLQTITPAVQASQYFAHLVDLKSARARIYEQMGNDSEARKAALEVVAMSHAGDVSEALRFAYRVLYTIEKAQGHKALALDYYEKYVIQDQGYLRDANVRNAAYEAARQHFVNEKLETEGLSKENRILRLQQALDGKAVETSRLYLVTMGLVLLSIVFWTLRLKRSQLRFKWLSSCDGLTGIFHHQYFMGEAERALRTLERRAGDGCLVFLDLDHFKQINDTHGHAVGDAALKHAVAICKGQLRKADILGRLGGEEFGMLLMDTPRLQGSVVAERIRLALSASPLLMDGAVISFSASIGLVCTDTTGYDLQRLCRAADAELYRAKRSGRNRVAIEGDADDAPTQSLAASAAASGLPQR